MSDGMLDHLTQRLDRLERENRRLRLLGALALLGASALVLMGQTAPSPVVNTLEAERFVLRDGAGNVRASLGLRPDGTAALVLADDTQQERVVLSVTAPGLAGLDLSDRTGHLRAGLGVRADGAAQLSLLDQGDRPRVEIKAHGDGRPSVFGLRLLQAAGRTTQAELIIAHSGEASLFPTATPIERHAVFSEIVPAGSRTPPDRMVALANAYFDGIEVDSGANVPVTDDCNRIENGVQTTNTERSPNTKCNTLEPFDYITEVRERRFPVVDEERGVVVGLVAFYIPGGDYERVVDGMKTMRHYDPRALFLFEGFKIENGKVRLIEATMRNMPLGSTMGWSTAR